MAVKLKGNLVDANGVPRTNCIVTVKYRGEIVSQVRVSGAFEEAVVFRPTAPDPLIVRAACPDAHESFEKQIGRVPEKFSTPVDLGDVVLR
jgi:hypothetical protein